MSADVVVGVAVLVEPELPDRLSFLHYVGRYGATGKHFQCWMQAFNVEVGKPNLNIPIWGYRKVGPILHVSPSINDLGRKWHNAAAWSIPFVPWDRERYPQDADDQCRWINVALLHPS